MITPAGRQPPQAAELQGRALPAADDAADLSFGQILAGAGVPVDGFLGRGCAASAAEEADAGAPAAAQIFNERGFFGAPAVAPPGDLSGGAATAGASPPAGDPADSSPPAALTPALPPSEGSESLHVSALSPLVGQPAPMPRYPPATINIGDLAGATQPGSVLAQSAGPAAAPANAPQTSPTTLQAGFHASLAGPGAPQLAGAAPSRTVPHRPQQALTAMALTLSGSLGTTSVSAQAPGLSSEERDRLERRIAGELARHGLVIGRITISAPAAVRTKIQGD
jgi:hypothetical protein